MTAQRFSASFTIALVFVFAVPLTAGQKNSSGDDCNFGGYGYEQVLDGYFAHARGSSPSVVVLRVYGGLDPEYEIVIDLSRSTHTLFRYTAKKTIWGKAFDDYMGTHKDAAGYIPNAIKVPVLKEELEIAAATLQNLLGRAKAISSGCEKGPFIDSKGGEVVILDAPFLELITNSGQIRARVTDTGGTDIVSENPVLLQWAMDMRNAATAKP